MTEIKIDKDVPLPSARGGGGAKYPWQEMDVGDSFFVSGKTSGEFGGAISSAKARSGYRFSARTLTENGVKGCRIWRVE